MNVTDPILRVSVVSTGQVQIRPDHLASTWRPTAWWLLASRRWIGPRPINAYVIEHRDGLVLFDTGQDRASVTDPGYFPGGITGALYDRLARFQINPQQTLSAGLDRLGYAAGASPPRSSPTAHLLQAGHIPRVGSRRRLREATAMINTMRQRHPGLVILPAHDPAAASRLAQATGQAPKVATASHAGDRHARGHPGQRHHTVDPGSRSGRVQPGAAADPARPRPADDQRSAARHRLAEMTGRLLLPGEVHG